MKVNARFVLAAAAALLGAALPLSNVEAHACQSLMRQSPSDPGNADTGCDASSCPGDSGSFPHDHENVVPPGRCRNDGPSPECPGGRHGKGKGHEKGPGGQPAPEFPGPGSASGGGAADAVLGLCHNVQLGPGAAQDGPLYHCLHASPHSHSYLAAGSVFAGAEWVTAEKESSVGVVAAYETNLVDCDGNGVPGDFDGDYETGVGGAFLGGGVWANEPICQYGLATHGALVRVDDFLFHRIPFVVGADDQNGPQLEVDPLTGATSCSTSGTIMPGDPATDPTADLDDCLTPVLVGTGSTCGYGGDGGYWVFLYGAGAVEGSGGLSITNPPLAGSITA